jgi:hypothetical protein
VDDHPVAPDPSGAELAGLAVLHQRLAREQHDLLEGMARSFGGVLADAMRIERRGLLNSGRVKAIAITLDDKTFELREERGEIRSSIGHTVGGVVLSHAACAIEAWLDQLFGALDAAARRSDRMRAALSRLA